MKRVVDGVANGAGYVSEIAGVPGCFGVAALLNEPYKEDDAESADDDTGEEARCEGFTVEGGVCLGYGLC